MEKIILTAPAILALAAIGVAGAEDSAAVSAAIVTLHGNFNTEKSAHDATKVALKNMTEVQVTRDVDAALLAGKITADVKETYKELGMGNYDLFSRTLAALPAKTTLSGKVANSNEGGDEPKDMDEFEKLTDEKKLAFKNSNPDAYAALFK